MHTHTHTPAREETECGARLTTLAGGPTHPGRKEGWKKRNGLSVWMRLCLYWIACCLWKKIVHVSLSYGLGWRSLFFGALTLTPYFRMLDRFDIALVNRYRTGKVEINWHADAEPDLAQGQPVFTIPFGM